MKKLYILHGWSIDPKNENKWFEFRQTLESKNIKTIFLKVPGLDFSLEHPWTLSDYVKWLESQLPNERIILLGHSFGGQLAIKFASQNPKFLEKLVVIDSSGIIDKSLGKVLKRNLFYVVAKVGKVFTKSNYFRNLLYKVAREKDYVSASDTMKQTMKNVISEEIISDLPHIKVPTLILWGARDSATPVSFSKILKNGIKNSELVIIDEARHAPQFTHPQETAQKVAAFILKG